MQECICLVGDVALPDEGPHAHAHAHAHARARARALS